MNYKFIILILLFILNSIGIHAQTKDLSNYRCAFYENYQAGNMLAWPNLIEEMEQVKTASFNWQLEILKAMYGLVGYQIGTGDKEIAKKYVTKADKYLDKLLSQNPENAQLQSLAGAFYGYKISFAVYKAPFLGPKSLDHINKALKLDPAEPMGYVVKGYSLSYRPPVFGGDKEEALKYFQKALTLFETQSDSKCNWQKMLLRTFILKTLYEIHRDAEAKIYLESMQKEYGPISWIKKFVGTEYMGTN